MTAVGLVCALGYDAPTALAAARAQVSRATVQQHYRMRSGLNGAEEPVVGHSADLLTLGFGRELRLQRLAEAALSQLRDAIQPGRDGRIGLFAVLAGQDAAGSGADEPAGAEPDEGTTPVDSEARARSCLERALAAAQLGCSMHEVTCSARPGRVGALRMLGAAASALQRGSLDMAIVLATDTLLDADSLERLHGAGRLKCEAVPDGLQPGEAAVALLLRHPDSHHQAEAMTRLHTVAIDDGAPPHGDSSAPPGEALARVLRAAAKGNLDRRAWVLVDHNGEFARGHDWGSAWSRLRAQDEAYANAEVWYPALAFGDTGAAGALAAVAMVRAAHDRGYAPGNTALVACADEGQGRAALLLQQH